MFLLILLGVLGALAYYIHHVYTYWQRQGFPYDTASGFPFGAMESVVKRQKSFGMAINDVYLNSSKRFLGIYLFFRPAILVRDAELARQILVQDFSSFHDRGIYCDEKNDPYSGNLFNLPGERWRSLRTKLAPSFTSGKLKSIFSIVDDVGNEMMKYLDKTIPEEGEVVMEMKEFFSRYAIDIIGSAIFGIEVNSFTNPNNPLRKTSDQFSKPTFFSVVRGTSAFLFPALQKLFVRLGLPDPVADFMKDMVRQTVEYREKNNVHRKDMMQMLIELRNTGKINLDDDVWKGQSIAENLKSMSIDCIAGQAFLFYVAGFDTTAGTAAFTIFELAKYPEILAKVQKDIKQALDKHEGKITYESIKDMTYLDLCVKETIRKYPALPILNRECTIDFKVPDSDKVIKKGTPIVISLFGIHRDPKYFPDPMKYDPERFLEETKNYNPIAYMPFGEGPRHCIAQRMGTVNVKVALAKVLMSYEIAAAQEGEIEVDNFAVTIAPKGGANIKLRKRKQPL
ncbi:probable cytochrome P450 6d4 [Eupeodes corollae]|uniref:probable cytochrome P450 6d4 n=1 Tax=Eupeodes corollae TaxID=290404 RepID=UPI00249059AA|nr:probable cytochrome P450 6d4 [Eupeodes corollae]